MTAVGSGMIAPLAGASKIPFALAADRSRYCQGQVKVGQREGRIRLG